MKLTSIKTVPEKPADWKWLKKTITLCAIVFIIIMPGIFIQQWTKKDTATKVVSASKETIPVGQTTLGDWGLIAILFSVTGLILYLAYKEVENRSTTANPPTSLNWVEVWKTPAWLTLVGVVVVNLILALVLYPLWSILWDHQAIFWAVNLGAVIIVHFATKESRGAKIAAGVIAFILLLGIALPIWKDYRRGKLTLEEYATKVAIEEVIEQEEVVKQLAACDPHILGDERLAKSAVETYRNEGLLPLLEQYAFPEECLPEIDAPIVNLVRRLEITPDAWTQEIFIPTMKTGWYTTNWSSQGDYVTLANGETDTEKAIKKNEKIEFIVKSMSVTAVGAPAHLRIWLVRNR